MMWNISLNLQILCLKKKTKAVVALEDQIPYLYTLGNMFLQEIFQGKFICRYMIKNINTQAELNFQLQLCSAKKGNW